MIEPAATSQGAAEIKSDVSRARESLAPRQAMLAHWDGHLEEAAALYKQAIDLDPDLIISRVWYAILLMQTDQRDAAVTQLWRACEIDPDLTANRLEIAYHENPRDESIVTLRELVALWDRDDEAATETEPDVRSEPVAAAIDVEEEPAPRPEVAGEAEWWPATAEKEVPRGADETGVDESPRPVEETLAEELLVAVPALVPELEWPTTEPAAEVPGTVSEAEAEERPERGYEATAEPEWIEAPAAEVKVEETPGPMVKVAAGPELLDVPEPAAGIEAEEVPGPVAQAAAEPEWPAVAVAAEMPEPAMELETEEAPGAVVETVAEPEWPVPAAVAEIPEPATEVEVEEAPAPVAEVVGEPGRPVVAVAEEMPEPIAEPVAEETSESASKAASEPERLEVASEAEGPAGADVTTPTDVTAEAVLAVDVPEPVTETTVPEDANEAVRYYAECAVSALGAGDLEACRSAAHHGFELWPVAVSARELALQCGLAWIGLSWAGSPPSTRSEQRTLIEATMVVVRNELPLRRNFGAHLLSHLVQAEAAGNSYPLHNLALPGNTSTRQEQQWIDHVIRYSSLDDTTRDKLDQALVERAGGPMDMLIVETIRRLVRRNA